MKHYIVNKIKQNIGFILLMAAILTFYFSFGCPLRFLLGICCPGCGMSRAVEAVLNFDFPLAFEMHPLVFLLPVAAMVYLLRKRLPKTIITMLCITAMVLMLVTYVIRLRNGSNVVYIDFERGFLYRMFHHILN